MRLWCYNWIDETHMAIIKWETDEKDVFMGKKRISESKSPFFNETKTYLEMCECELHIHALILENMFNNIEVTSFVVLLQDDDYYIKYKVDHWKECKCTSFLRVKKIDAFQFSIYDKYLTLKYNGNMKKKYLNT